MLPRRILVNRDAPGFYHCISRCVRQAFLCGDGYDHRRGWIAARLRELSRIFSIDVVAYAVMSNHFHVILWTDPERAQNWSKRQVAKRWVRLFPRKRNSGRTEQQEIKAIVGDSKRLEEIRARLADLSWFMRCLKEYVAVRANKEDDCTGCFWESRFKSHALLDLAAVLACCIYVDLNLIRAGIARTLEASSHTSIRDRIHVLWRFRKLTGKQATAPPEAESLILPDARDEPPTHEEDGIWLTPIQARHGEQRRGALDMDLEQYIEIAEATACVARGEQTAIVEQLIPSLERLDIDVERWATCLRGLNRMLGTAIGSAANLVKEARRRGRKRVVAVFDVYKE